MGTGRRVLKTGFALAICALMLFPVYWMVDVSLTPRSALRDAALFPQDATLANYRVALQSQLPYLGTSLVVGLGTVLLTLVIAAPAGFALSQLRLPGRRVLTFSLIVAQMVPTVVIALGIYQIYSDLGLLSSIPGLVVADSTVAVPFAVMLFASFMASVPEALMQAAAIDGASHWRSFVAIVLPMSRNAAVTVSLFAFLWAWSDFLFASTLDASGGTRRPITMGIYDYIGAQNQEWGPIMATGVLASIPTALLLVLAQRYVAAGLTAGAVKD